MSDSATMEKAEGGVSLTKVLNAGVRKYSRAIINNLAIALKVTKLYSFQHQNVSEALKDLNEFLNGFLKMEEYAQILRVGDFLFLNEVRIRVDFGGNEAFQFVLALMRDNEIGEINFSSGVSMQELEALIQILNAHKPDPDDRWKSFSTALGKQRLPHIAIREHVERPDLKADINEDTRVVAIRTYFKTVGVMEDAFTAIRQKKRINLRRIKMAVHALVDLTLNEERILLALANTKDRGKPGTNHAVNVAVLSIALGAKLGLSKRLLGDLGIAALLHDVGKATLPPALQEVATPDLTQEQRAALANHPVTGVETLLTQRVVNSIVKTINVAFLHHYRYDGTGHPKLLLKKEQNLYTRIIAVANAYDSLTTKNKVERVAKDQHSTLKLLMDRKGTEFDPLVVKAFVNMMGLYPVGCVVRLDSGEVGTVLVPSSNARFLDRPTVNLITDAAGNPTEGRVDLMERDAGGAFVRSILKLYQQEEVNLDLDEYLSVI